MCSPNSGCKGRAGPSSGAGGVRVQPRQSHSDGGEFNTAQEKSQFPAARRVSSGKSISRREHTDKFATGKSRW